MHGLLTALLMVMRKCNTTGGMGSTRMRMHGLLTALLLVMRRCNTTGGMGGNTMDITMDGMDVIGVMTGNGTVTMHPFVAAGKHMLLPVDGVTMMGMGGNRLQGNDVPDPDRVARAVSLRRLEMTRLRRQAR